MKDSQNSSTQRMSRMINTARIVSNTGMVSKTMPDAFIPWKGVKVSGIIIFLDLSISGCWTKKMYSPPWQSAFGLWMPYLNYTKKSKRNNISFRYTEN